MSAPDTYYFQQLKKDIAHRLQEAFPAITPEIGQWRGQEIGCFQHDLMEKVQGRVSEKWFYTHIKAEQESLPRIDILDLLSKYAGFQNWQAYKASHIQQPEGKPKEVGKKAADKKAKTPIMYVSLVIVFALLMIVYINLGRTSTYQFCFVNAYNKNPVRSSEIDVILLQNEESPYWLKPDENGCFGIQSHEEQVRFVVKGAYYMTDTITRILNKAKAEEQIALAPNDYALMIHLFSNARVEDWQKRRSQLESMFAEEAHIYQVFSSDALGIEMYNKQEFIDKLTMPIRSLQNIEVLETTYEKGKIKALRFRQLNEKNHE